RIFRIVAGSLAVRRAAEAVAVARCLRGPGAGDTSAEERWTQHGAFQRRASVDVAARHAGDLARSEKPFDRLEMPVEDAAPQVGLDAAEILARQGEDLHRIVGWRIECL